jgi:type IV conjugative transfer system coupling protein TraD
MSHSVNHMTRGGQVWAHQIRMALQVLKNTFLISLALSVCGLLFVFFKTITLETVYLALIAWWAETKITFATLMKGGIAEITFWHAGQWQTWKAFSFVNHPFVQEAQNLTQLAFAKALSSESLPFLLWSFIGSFFLVGTYFYVTGRSVRQKKHVRGLKIASLKQLKRLMKKRNLKSMLHLDGIPLVKDRETSHMLIAGTTGSGKTNALNHLLPQIRHQKSVIVDLTGELTKRYFDATRDVVLSPSHPETSFWNPWLDAKNAFEFRAFASAFVGEGSKHDPFWADAAKECLAAALEKLSDVQSLPTLIEILTKTDLKTFCRFFEGTSAAAYADPKGERTTVSIRSTLSSRIQSLDILQHQQQGDFSLRSWIQQDPLEGGTPGGDTPGWLFLTTKPDEREVLCPLISAQLGVTLKGLMQLSPDANRRCWFIIDELPALNKTPALLTTATEGRKYGACLVAGIQDMAQLKSKYGHDEAATLLNQMNTKVFFRFTDPQNALMISKMLGEKEEKSVKENISYGANTIRDGVSLNEATSKEPLVMPTEIAALKNLECFIRLPEDLPIVKHQMRFKALEEKDPNHAQ